MLSVIRDNDDIKDLEQIEKSRVRSNERKKVSSDDMSSAPGMIYREGREKEDIRMKKKNCNNRPNGSSSSRTSIWWIAPSLEYKWPLQMPYLIKTT